MIETWGKAFSFNPKRLKCGVYKCLFFGMFFLFWNLRIHEINVMIRYRLKEEERGDERCIFVRTGGAAR
jgi:hypothetical protein